MSKLICQTIKVAALSHEDLRALFDVLRVGFLGVTWEEFTHDISEKDCVMILKTPGSSSQIVGFSTMMVIPANVNGRSVRFVFSGDTFVLPEYRSSTSLGIELGKNFLQIHEQNPLSETYYILISKGWRTYRALPFMFRCFAPCVDRPNTEWEQKLMDEFGRIKYPSNYNSASGLIEFQGDVQRLKTNSVDAYPSNTSNKHISYFLKRNPNYLNGNELVCIARIDPGNFTEAYRHYVIGKE